MSYIVGPSTRMLFAQVRDAREPITMPVIARRVLTSLPMFGRRVLRGNTATREPREIAKPSLVIASSHTGIRRYAFHLTGSASPFTPDNWAWDFGDGSTGTGATPTHTYAAPGNYDVSVVVSDGFDIVGRYLYLAFPVDSSPAPVATTYYPIAGELGATDGIMDDHSGGFVTAQAAFSDARTPAVNPPNSSNTSDPSPQFSFTLAGTYAAILRRAYFRFDTSLLASPPISASLSAKLWSAADYGGSVPDGNVTGQALRLVVWDRAVPSADVDAPGSDWALLTGPALASDDSVSVDALSAGDTITFALNAAGLAAINQGDLSCLAIIMESDRVGTVPVGIVNGSYMIVSLYGMDDEVWAADWVAPSLTVTA